MTARIATHPTRPASAVEVERFMSCDDVSHWHDLLDQIDDANERARRAAEKK